MKALLAPILGGIIGYITNDLAIRMLFRPRKAYYIGKFHIPFTPGLIPSQQGRLAQSIGSIVSDQLLNEETLRQTLLSDEAVDKLRERLRGVIRGFSEDRRTLSGVLTSGKRPVDVDALQQRLAEALSAKIVEAKLGYAVIESTIGEKTDVITHNKLFAAVVGTDTKEAIKKKLAGMVDDLIAERAPDVSASIVAKYRAELLDVEIRDIYEKYRDREEPILQRATELYVSLLGDNLGKLLRAINVEQIVVDKVNALEPAQLEAVIFDVMKHELRAIVYLGALLGFLMGFINLLL